MAPQAQEKHQSRKTIFKNFDVKVILTRDYILKAFRTS